MRLRGQVVNLVRPHLLDYPPDSRTVAEVTIVKLQPVRITPVPGAEMVDSARGETRGAPDYPMHLVAFLEQQFGQI